MHISKVELENIKSHTHSTFDFSPGTTAITGENGAGKTTIIEAIAWTLFDLLEYRKEEFVRRGAQKGIARVTFESGLDEREYLIYRDTSTGYYVFDPAINTRIANKKEEVTRFLWQHLGLEPGTDLRALFKEAVGVPQGTLTAIFLATPAERKSIFDRLLKVEEYRQAAEKLRETTRFVEQGTNAVNVGIARSEGELTRVDTVEEEYRGVSAESERLTGEASQIESGIAEKSERIKGLEEQEKKLAALTSELDRARSAKTSAELICRQRETELKQASDASEIVESVRAAAQRHTEILGKLKELDRERVEREKLRSKLREVESAESKVRAQQTTIQQQLESVQNAHSQIDHLKTLIPEQTRLEKEIGELRSRIAQSRAIEGQIKSLDERLGRLRESYKSNQTKIREAESQAADAVKLPELEVQDTALVRRIAELRATLERDQRLQSEIKNGLCPILSEKCRNLDNGQTLEGFIKEQFTDLRSQISNLESEHTGVATALKTARTAEKYTKALEALKATERELTGEGKCLAEERESLVKQLGDPAALDKELGLAEDRLLKLDNPKARLEVYEKEAAREPDIRLEITKIEKNLERLESDRRIVVEQLETYKDLDELWTSHTTERDATTEAYQKFLGNETAASKLSERQTAFNEANDALNQAAVQLENAETASAEAAKDYDRERHYTERAALTQLQTRLASVTTSLQITLSRLDQLGAELKRLTDLRKSLKAEYAERDRLGKVLETTTFIRETLREAAPRVARNYVHFVSLEANQLYREISGKIDQSLEWSDDYGIVVDEEGYKRPFLSLSGGEQMAAALSVRLAILKQLSDIRIAFFDEPTTNMDAERRENLAQEISRIKNFDQLFVISHDDTFEGYVDQTVRVRRSAEQSSS
jgi:exonuclease SbcC